MKGNVECEIEIITVIVAQVVGAELLERKWQIAGPE